MRRLALPLLLSLLVAVPALAGWPTSRARVLLTLSDSYEDLRARLAAYADSTLAGDRYGAGEAWYLVGLSLQREGRVDSAIVCLRRAAQLRGGEDEIFDLADQLLLRRGPGDVAEAIAALEPLRVSALANPARRTPVLGRLAWARFQAGQVDSAGSLFDAVGAQLETQPEWRYRIGRVRLAQRRYRDAGRMLLANAVLSRGTDDEVIGMLESLGDSLGMTSRIREEVLRQSHERDKVEQALAKSVRGTLVSLRASDGFPLVGLALGPKRPASAEAAAKARRLPLAVVVMAPGDTLASGDSLAVALRRHGWAVLLLQPRGSGNSVAPPCPLPDAWLDREVAMQTRVARDVGEAARGLARMMSVDTTRLLVAGVGPTTAIAVEAATLDRRVRALLLVSAAPPLTERGITRARLARLQMPVFFQNAAEDFSDSYEINEALFQAGNQSASRSSETTSAGRGLRQFRGDPQALGRLLTWLDATLPRTPAPRPTPPRGAPGATRSTPPPPRR